MPTNLVNVVPLLDTDFLWPGPSLSSDELLQISDRVVLAAGKQEEVKGFDGINMPKILSTSIHDMRIGNTCDKHC